MTELETLDYWLEENHFKLLKEHDPDLAAWVEMVEKMVIAGMSAAGKTLIGGPDGKASDQWISQRQSYWRQGSGARAEKMSGSNAEKRATP